MITNLSKQIIDNLSLPFILYDLFPFAVEFFNTEFYIDLFVCYVFVSPFLSQVFNIYSSSYLAQASTILLKKFHHQFTRVFGKDILRRLAGRHTSQKLVSKFFINLEKLIKLQLFDELSKLIFDFLKLIIVHINLGVPKTFLYLSAPIPERNIKLISCCQHGGVLYCEDRISVFFDPIRIKASMVQYDINKENDAFLLEFDKDILQLSISLRVSAVEHIRC